MKDKKKRFKDGEQYIFGLQFPTVKRKNLQQLLYFNRHESHYWL